MKMYITFGQVHTHSINGKTFDRDCVAVIDCENETDGRKKAFEYFGGKFCFLHLEVWCNKENMKFFPRGLIRVE